MGVTSTVQTFETRLHLLISLSMSLDWWEKWRRLFWNTWMFLWNVLNLIWYHSLVQTTSNPQKYGGPRGFSLFNFMEMCDKSLHLGQNKTMKPILTKYSREEKHYTHMCCKSIHWESVVVTTDLCNWSAFPHKISR